MFRRPGVVFVFYLLIAAGCCWIVYPGAMTPDSITSYFEGRQGEYTLQHPPVYALIWRLSQYLTDGTSAMLILQQLIFWSGLALLALSNSSTPHWLRYTAALIGLTPPIFIHLSLVTKDTLYLALIMFEFGLLFMTYFRKKLAIGFLSLPVLILISALRHNSLSITLIFVIFHAMLYTYLKNLRSPRCYFYSIISGLLFSVLLFFGTAIWNVKLATGKRLVTSGVMTYELVALSARTGENVLPDFWRADYSVEQLEKLYSPYGCNTTFWSDIWPISAPDPDRCEEYVQSLSDPRKGSASGEVQKKRLPDICERKCRIDGIRSAWMSAIIRHPTAYLMHKIEIAKALLGIKGGSVCYPYHDTCLYNEALRAGISHIDLKSRQYQVNRIFTGFVYSLRNSIFFQGWAYLLGLLFAVLFLFFHADLRSSSVYFVAPLIGLSNILFLTALTPSCDFRYLLPSVLGFWICLFSIVDFFMPRHSRS